MVRRRRRAQVGSRRQHTSSACPKGQWFQCQCQSESESTATRERVARPGMGRLPGRRRNLNPASAWPSNAILSREREKRSIRGDGFEVAERPLRRVGEETRDSLSEARPLVSRRGHGPTQDCGERTAVDGGMRGVIDAGRTAGCDVRDGRMDGWKGWLCRICRFRSLPAGFPGCKRPKSQKAKMESPTLFLTVAPAAAWCLLAAACWLLLPKRRPPRRLRLGELGGSVGERGRKPGSGEPFQA